MTFRSLAILVLLSACSLSARDKPNVLFIISDDLTATALGCYGNKLCKTLNIDRLATEGTRFTRAYCQATFCGPSRASLMFGYYPYASKATGYTSGRKEVGEDKDSWPQYFRKNGYHSARVSKVFHMGVPPDIAKGSDGADDPASWDEKFNSPGPESKAPGFGETPMPEWFRDFDDLTILYDQFFEQLGIDQLHLIGFSMGGWAASEFASFFPRRLKSLSLITPVGLRLKDKPGIDIFQLTPDQLMDRLFDDKEVMQQFAVDPDDFDEGIHLYSEFSAAARLMWAPRYNLALERRLQRLNCPTLVVGGSNDRLIPNEMSDKFAEVLPNSRLVRIPETGHEPCLERPRELVDELLIFIEEASK